MGPRIVIDDAVPYYREAFERLGELRPYRGTEITRQAVRNADVLVVRSVTRIDPKLLEGTSVRMVASATSGEDHIDREGLEDLGIEVFVAAGCNAQAVAEYVVSLLAHGSRWRVGTPPGPVGVIGLGHIGRRTARVLRSLGYDVMACDPPLAERRADKRVITDPDPTLANLARFERLGTLDSLLESSFVITLHVPLKYGGPHPTHHMLDERRLQRLRHGQLLINTSRGGVVDDRALERWIATADGRAMLDVWEGEPNLRAGLLQGAGAVRMATPHVAGYTLEGKVAATRMVHEAVCRFLGQAPSFDGRSVLGAPGTMPLTCDHPDAPHDWRRWIEAALPMVRVDQRLRRCASLPLGERGPAFERLRRGYTLRRELSAFTVHDASLDPETHQRLAALGISVPPDPTARPRPRGYR